MRSSRSPRIHFGVRVSPVGVKWAAPLAGWRSGGGREVFRDYGTMEASQRLLCS